MVDNEQRKAVGGMLKRGVLWLLLAAAGVVLAEPDPRGRVPFADPHILCHDDSYYAYGTFSKDGIGVAVSRDLEHWQFMAGRAPGGLALHKDDV